MGHNKNAWIEKYKDSGILFYRRDVDDTFCVFEREQDSWQDDVSFYNYINSQQLKLRFTMEKEVNHKLAFSDVLIHNNPLNLRKFHRVCLPIMLVQLHSPTKLVLLESWLTGFTKSTTLS